MNDNLVWYAKDWMSLRIGVKCYLHLFDPYWFEVVDACYGLPYLMLSMMKSNQVMRRTCLRAYWFWFETFFRNSSTFLGINVGNVSVGVDRSEDQAHILLVSM